MYLHDVKIKLLQLGKTQEEYLKTGVSGYEKKISRFLPYETETIPSPKITGSLKTDQLKIREGEQILSRLKSGDKLVLLDDKGQKYTSEGFSDYLQRQMNSSIKTLVFCVGGAYGFSEKVYEKSDDLISLSPMTFSHQLVRLIFTEQLYRALCIKHNHPYHHD